MGLLDFINGAIQAGNKPDITPEMVYNEIRDQKSGMRPLTPNHVVMNGETGALLRKHLETLSGVSNAPLPGVIEGMRLEIDEAFVLGQILVEVQGMPIEEPAPDPAGQEGPDPVKELIETLQKSNEELALQAEIYVEDIEALKTQIKDEGEKLTNCANDLEAARKERDKAIGELRERTEERDQLKAQINTLANEIKKLKKENKGKKK